MKTFQYTYNYKPAIYNYLMRDILLCDIKKEKEILQLLIDGKTCSQIANEVGYSERTIQRRRKEIYEKTKDLMV